MINLIDLVEFAAFEWKTYVLINKIKVVFDRIKTIFQGFECGWSVQRGIEDMVSKFQDLRLSSEKFRSQQFYRLQAIEKLFQEGRLNEDVCWRKK